MFPQSFLFVVLAALATAQPVELAATVDAAVTKNFQFFGINESGPEFGEKIIPGVKNTEVYHTLLSSIHSFDSR